MASIIRKLSFIMTVAGLAIAVLPPAARAAERREPAEPTNATTATKDPEAVDLPSWGKKKKEEQKPAAAPAGPGVRKQEEPAFDEVIKDFEKIDGLFTVYRKDDRYLMAVKPDQMDKDFMVSVTRETGIGESF